MVGDEFFKTVMRCMKRFTFSGLLVTALIFAHLWARGTAYSLALNKEVHIYVLCTVVNTG